VFPAIESLAPSPELRNATVYYTPTSPPLATHESVRARLLELHDKSLSFTTTPSKALVAALTQLIRDLRPDLVSSQSLQPSAYLAYEARHALGPEFPAWLVVNWGSDVYYWGRHPSHVEHIRAVLSSCDYYACECHRDLGLARAFGYRGPTLPVVPICGGFDLEDFHRLREPGRPSGRRSIAIKGLQGQWGRAFVAIEALDRCRDLLEGYTIGVYLADPGVGERVSSMFGDRGLNVEILMGDRPLALPHEEILRLHGRSRLSVGLSLSDGISTSFLEAMAMGSFPIQSNTGCAIEWADHGTSALFVEPEDVDEVTAAIRRVLVDDELVDSAARMNETTARVHLDRRMIQARTVEAYEQIAADIAFRSTAPA
jgi:glycosyltransferase involved in cell wall biosynthesis